jgi:nucleotide-binding universal stress UspA family protein
MMMTQPMTVTSTTDSSETESDHGTRLSGSVIVAFSQSAASVSALRWAMDHAADVNVSIRVVHVLPACRRTEPNADRNDVRILVQHRVSDIVAAGDLEVPVSMTFLEGALEESLIQAADEATLLVIGKAGDCRHHGLEDRLRDLAACPVVAIARGHTVTTPGAT